MISITDICEDITADSTAAEIFDEVEAEVSALNGEVVLRAINGHCCNYPTSSRSEFEELLYYYIGLRKQEHHIKIRLYGRGYFDPRNGWLSATQEQRLYKELRATRYLAQDARRRLKNLWPCAACIWLYNPTNRTRRFPSLIC